MVISDGTGRITLRFFHFRAAQKNQLSRGTRLRCYGEVRGGYQGLDMVHPSYKRILSEQDEAVSDRLTPVYPSVEGLGQASWIKLSDQALALLQSHQLELEELLPDDLRGNLKIPSLACGRWRISTALLPGRTSAPWSSAGIPRNSGWQWKNCWRTTSACSSCTARSVNTGRPP